MSEDRRKFWIGVIDNGGMKKELLIYDSFLDDKKSISINLFNLNTNKYVSYERCSIRKKIRVATESEVKDAFPLIESYSILLHIMCESEVTPRLPLDYRKFWIGVIEWEKEKKDFLIYDSFNEGHTSSVVNLFSVNRGRHFSLDRDNIRWKLRNIRDSEFSEASGFLDVYKSSSKDFRDKRRTRDYKSSEVYATYATYATLKDYHYVCERYIEAIIELTDGRIYEHMRAMLELSISDRLLLMGFLMSKTDDGHWGDNSGNQKIGLCEISGKKMKWFMNLHGTTTMKRDMSQMRMNIVIKKTMRFP